MTLLEAVNVRAQKLVASCQPARRRAPAVKARSELSTGSSDGGGGALGAKPRSELSTVADIERKLKERGISLRRMLGVSGSTFDSWYLAKAGGNTRDDTFRRWEQAIDALQPTSRQARPPAAIAALIRAIEELITAAIGRNRKLMVACDPLRQRRGLPEKLHPARLRLLAIYVAAVDLEIKNPEIGRALNIERQAVKQSRDKIHELYDTDKRVAALLDRVAAQVKGERT